MKKAFYSILFFFFLSFSALAQTGAIRGRVIDSENLSIPAANVFIQSLMKGTITDVNGYYTLTGISEGTHTVSISYIGFKPMTKDVKVTAGKTTVVDLQLEPGVEIAEVVVTGRLQGQSKALNQQKNSMNISNVIAADQVGKFPDANIGDALKRIPGINVQYDQGEARFGNIRGTAPQYNSITINGERIPSAEAEIREIQLDLVPSDMVKMIEVNKAITPDMDADAIGASINLVTKAAPYKRRISGSLGTGYNILAGKPMWTGSLMFGERFLNDKIGMVLSASYHNHKLGSDNLEPEWGYDDANDNDQFDEGEDYWPEEVQMRQYYLQRIRQSYSAAFDFKLNENHTIFLKGIYNWRNDWENRYRTVYKDIEEDGGTWVAEIEKQTKAGVEDNKYARLEDQRMMNFSLAGDHLFGRIELDWSASYAKASEERPHERYIQFATDDATEIDLDLSDEKKPMVTVFDASYADLSNNWELDELTEEYQYTEDEDVNGRINIMIPIVSGKFENFIKFGGRFTSKTKYRDNNFFEYSPLNEDAFTANALNNTEDWTKDDFMAGDYEVGHTIDPEYLGDLDLNDDSQFEKEADFSEYAGNFDATESIIAGYLMLNQKLGEKVSAIAGIRLEQTNSENEGREYNDDDETLETTDKISNDYLNILPNLHLRYTPMENTVIRVAYTNTIARPNYFDLVPYREIEDGDEIKIGNPELEPTSSMNFDLMLEHYFKTIGIISGGFFFKDIKDFMVFQRHKDYIFDGTTWGKFQKPINGGNATLWGLEVAAQRRLDFLPGVLKGFGIYANYTYTNSEITDFNIEGREDETLPMPGSPEHTLNASLSYESKKFTGRVSFNYASDFISEVGEEAFFDRYYDKVTYLDLNLTYRINHIFTIFADLNNILNQPLRYYQGETTRTMQAEYYGMRMQVGLKFDL